jgi:hypothetical protein
MQPYFNPARRNMEDNLNIFENRRQPQIFLKMEDDLNFFSENGRRCFENGRRPQICLKMEDDLKCFSKWKTTFIVFENGRQP